jgi:hypothetical protein
MDAVVASCVVPASVHVDERARSVGHGKVAVGAVHVSAGALAFEVINDVGERFPLEQIVFDGEGAGMRMRVCLGIDHQLIVAGLVPCGEVSEPEGVAPCSVPLVYLSGWVYVTRKDCAASFGVHQGEVLWVVLLRASDERLLGRAGFIADVIDEHAQLGVDYGRAESKRAERREADADGFNSSPREQRMVRG